jgi:hypothetical protein
LGWLLGEVPGERCHIAAQRLGNLAEFVEGQIPLTAFNPAVVAAVNITLESQSLLGEILELPHFADSFPKHLEWNWLSWHKPHNAQNADYSSTDYVAQNSFQ